jgi:kynurenine formamidase
MPPITRKASVAACFCVLWTSSATAVEFGEGVWVDLSHEFSEDMAGHPRSQPFVHTPGVVGMTRGGFYMATYNYSGSEHVGTHMDAPVHFHEGGKSIDQVSIDRLMGEVIVVNVQAQVAADPNYLVSVDDVLNWEQANGPMPDDCIVMFNTGLANVWPDPLKYVGTDKTGNEGVAELKYPAIHKDTASFLSTQRSIKAFGIDTISFDNSLQPKRMSHRIFFEHGIPGVENVANLDALPAKGAYMIGLPMKIKDGSAAPVRIIAFIPDQT